jgi:asparagine synthase (glutamine-hydrolysing)
MMSSLAHRGPDDCGTMSCRFGQNIVALGHTRLSIIDLSADGHQPMTESSARYSIVFNGEIYNFQELRKLLDAEGRLFRTSSDTEVILHAYARWSGDSFRALRGMFAFALLDHERRELHLVRDPLGIKPLYYYAAGGELLFASEVRSLLASGRVPRRVNTGAVSHFLSHGWVGSAQTLIDEVRELQPGEVLTVYLGGEQIRWKIGTYESCTPVEQPIAVSDRNESTAHILHLLQQSVKCHLVSDVPIGLFLSGGIDSTAILHLMRQVGVSRPKTFTVFFPEQEFSERRYAQRIAQRYDTEHSELELSESGMLAELPAALAAMDQPTMDGINTFAIAKSVRHAGVKVALSGLGGDELFAGYPSFRRLAWARRSSFIPKPIRGALAEGGMKLLRGPYYDKFWSLLSSDCTPTAVYEISRELFAPSEVHALLPGASAAAQLSPSVLCSDPINQMSCLELRGYMTDLLLRDTDVMGMASSLEVRVPFIDKTVIRHVLKLPGTWKAAGRTAKPLLLDAMRGAIPEFVWQRRKMGFAFPFERWLRQSLRSDVQDTLSNAKLCQASGIAPEAVRRIWRNFLAGDARWARPWSLFVLSKWCERHGVSV